MLCEVKCVELFSIMKAPGKGRSYFWNVVNSLLLKTESPMRGLVPTRAMKIKQEIKAGSKSTTYQKQTSPSTTSHRLTSETLRAQSNPQLLSTGRLSAASWTLRCSGMTPSVTMSRAGPVASSIRSITLAQNLTTLVFPSSGKVWRGSLRGKMGWPSPM